MNSNTVQAHHRSVSTSAHRGCLKSLQAMIAILFFTPLTVSAHHPNGGELPATITERLLSGVGHPVIGIDHLAFVIAAGILAALTRRGLLIPVTFVLGGFAGVSLHLQFFTVPAAEILVAASVLLFGLLLVLNKHLDVRKGVPLAVVAGVAHGYAYAEAIVGANMPALTAYLAGLTITQLAIALASFYLAARIVAKGTLHQYKPLRVAGAAVASIGAVFLTVAAFG